MAFFGIESSIDYDELLSTLCYDGSVGTSSQFMSELVLTYAASVMKTPALHRPHNLALRNYMYIMSLKCIICRFPP